jgi:HK97 family phage major capsid protein
VPAQYRAQGKWVMNSNTMKAVEKIKDSQNRYLIQSLINSSLQSPQFESIKGKPVFVDEFMQDIGTNNYPILFGDLSGYLIVDRVGFSVQRLQELYAETDITLLLARKRVGGQPIETYRMRVQKTT